MDILIDKITFNYSDVTTFGMDRKGYLQEMAVVEYRLIGGGFTEYHGEIAIKGDMIGSIEDLKNGIREQLAKDLFKMAGAKNE